MFVHDSAKLCKRTLTAAMPGHRQTLYKCFRDRYNFLQLQRRRTGAAVCRKTKKRKLRATERAFSPSFKP